GFGLGSGYSLGGRKMTDPAKKARLLIVDDVWANVKVLVETLRADYEISVALDGITALERVERDRPDLILLDVMRPDMDGYEVCRRLKADTGTRDILIIFVTAKDDSLD
ncbi:MAG: response regulator, partial [Magnetococcus sp. DMHC-1]